MIFKPWMRRNYGAKQFGMDVNYIIDHLDPIYKDRIEHPDKWQERKINSLKKLLADDKDYILKNPPKLVLNSSREIFRVDDGVSRIVLCKQIGIGKILVIVRIGDY